MGRGRPRKVVDVPQTEPDLDDQWKLDIYIPLTKLDDRLREASHEEVLAALLDLEPGEKAVALEFIVQRRMNLLCESNQSPEVESHG